MVFNLWFLIPGFFYFIQSGLKVGLYCSNFKVLLLVTKLGFAVGISKGISIWHRGGRRGRERAFPFSMGVAGRGDRGYFYLAWGVAGRGPNREIPITVPLVYDPKFYSWRRIHLETLSTVLILSLPVKSPCMHLPMVGLSVNPHQPHI